jgi:hypothetical protein
VLSRRWAWFEDQIDLDPEGLAFVDETWASTNMARRYGRCLRGERLRMSVPYGHWKTTTVIAGVRASGIGATLPARTGLTRNRTRSQASRSEIPCKPGRHPQEHVGFRLRPLLQLPTPQKFSLPSRTPLNRRFGQGLPG